MPNSSLSTWLAVATASVVVAGCGSSSHPARTSDPATRPSATSATASTPTSPAPVPNATVVAGRIRLAYPRQAGGAVVSPAAFGMHVLQFGSHPWPNLPIGSLRLWDNGVRWADLQPNGPQWDPAALARLDSLVSTARAHGADPILVLGMTPAWAARSCRHVVAGTDWGIATCAPKATGTSSPWASYVRFLAKRYKGKILSFETWNEPNLLNGWNDSPARLAALQATARSVIRSVDASDRLVSPSIAITCCDPVGWLDRYLGDSGGTAFDVFGIHLYPAPHQTPEWSMSVLAQVRAVLARHGVRAPVWDTEVDVGRKIAHETYGGARGAGLLARAYLVGTASGVQRTFWYAADDHTWSGIELEHDDYVTPTAAASAYRVVQGWLTGSRMEPCSSVRAAGRTVVSCGLTQPGGRRALVAWTTAGSVSATAPAGTTGFTRVDGSSGRTEAGTVTLTTSPVLLRAP